MPEEESFPRVTLAVADPEIRRRMLRILEDSQVRVEALAESADINAVLEGTGDADLVVVRRSQLADLDRQDLAAGPSDESPGVVVLTEDDDPADHARLLAAGATGVVPVEDSASDIADAVESLAATAAAGGQGAPDTGRNETTPRLTDFRSRSPRMKEFLELVSQVSRSDSSLLVTGETGVGKEHLARAIHAEGARATQPFVAVNCGALPEQLLESELFGHRAGAFTGALSDRLGRFQLADGGTIFLDEIGEMPSHLQVRLLTVLQNREVTPLGADEALPIDVRVIGATNRDIEEELATGRLREDLYYRLNVVTLQVPALRDRLEDLPDLIGRFMRHFRTSIDRHDVVGISAEALDALLGYSWPGNVRELINVVERALLVTSGGQITGDELPKSVLSGEAPRVDGSGSDAAPVDVTRDTSWDEPLKVARQRVVSRFERAYLHHVLSRARGKISEAARLSGITTRALYGKMKTHGLKKEDYF